MPALCQTDGGLEKSLFTVFADPAVHPAGATDMNLQLGANASLAYTQEPAEIAGSQKIKNIITLSLFEEIPLYVPGDFTAKVTVQIDYGASSNTTSQRIQELTVNYKKGSGEKYNAKNYFHFNGAEYVKVTITAFDAPTVAGFDTKKMLVLQNEMRITRYYQLANNVQPQSFSSIAPAAGADELEVSWQWPQGAGNTHTQLEWTWIENDLMPVYHDDNGNPDYNLIFQNNATRIDLPLSFINYKIPLLYGGPGKLFYRIRAVNIAENSRADGPWSTVQQTSLLPGHESFLNWQSTASYAEDGKRKVVVQYFDGSLRSRQTVTKENVNNTIVTAETLYDGQGRPAVQILPAPGISNIIAYTKNLNLFNGQQDNEDPAKYFDLEPIGSCGSATPALNPNALAFGAAKYYSTANPEKNIGVNKNIPDAEGYPYTVTHYTPDATGRIKAQSGVGAAMQMGSGQETKYYYGTASQQELDALFGTEVGDFSHYFKNMVKDANGQMSVSYVDMHGRTIATALAGDAPTNMVALDVQNNSLYPGQGGTEIKRNLLSENTNITKNNSVESINTLLVPALTDYEFKYKLAPDVLSLTVNSQSLCYDCMYDLEISIRDEACEGTPIIRKYNNISLSADDQCATGIQLFKTESNTPVPNNEIIFTETLVPGSYIVRKTLTISETSIEKYKQEYIAKALAQTEAQLVTEIYNQMLTTATCDDPTVDACVACTAALGASFEAYRDNYRLTAPQASEAEIQRIYNEEKLNCERLCNTASQAVATKRQLMIGDMMAYSGQYSKELEEGQTGGPMYQQYNINPAMNTAGNDPLLAEALLPQHPEFQRLQYAEGATMKNIYNWINTFNNTSYADALSLGYFTGDLTSFDPFYSPSVTPNYQAAMQAKTANYAGGLSMWKMAYGNAMCRSIADPNDRATCYQNAPAPPYANLGVAEQNKIWSAFKQLYISERENHVNDHIAVKHPIANDEALIDENYILRFPRNNTQLAEQLNRNSQSGTDWSWMPSSPGGEPNLSNFPGGGSTANIYAGRCNAYIEQWKQSLLNCTQLASLGETQRNAILTQITDAMKEICIASSNETNPYGASNVLPGTPGVAYQSFEAAIDAILDANNIDRTNFCNPFVIESPKPYANNTPLAKEYIAVVDKCNCEQFAAIKTEAQVAGADPQNLTSFNQFLQSKYGESLTQALYDALVQNCHKLGTTACKDVYSPEGQCIDRVCETVGNLFTLAAAQPMPAFLKCGFTQNIRCVTCAQLSGYITELKANFVNNGNTYVPEPLLTGSNLSAKNIQDNILFAQFVNYRTGFQYNWIKYAQEANAAGCNLDAYATNNGMAQTVICRDKPLTDPTDFITIENDACASVMTQAVAKAQLIMKQRRQALIEDFERAYRAKCMLTTGIEEFTVRYTPKEYHYTLYYYDMAGNLVKTVPPKGVVPNYGAGYLASVKAERDKMRAGQIWAPVVPDHVLATNYRYNSLNQVVQQKSPDAGISKFWYDRLGRLAVSQNAQQALENKYSYTLYDDFGRIYEVGQKPQSDVINQDITQNKELLFQWINADGGTKEQLTVTEYDRYYLYPNTQGLAGLMEQQNLRNRVSYTYTKELATDALHYTATFYTYDIHGNVDQLLQDYKGVTEMDGSGNRFKKITYNYDLISGKVNAVSYQPNEGDAFYHKYSYDAENRLTQVYTSRDQIVWERDAAYKYYKHGPLARTELGQLRVQGVDYAYTLQGWLKGVNAGTSVAANNETCAPGSAPDELIVTSRAPNPPATYRARVSIVFDPDFETTVGDDFDTEINSSLIACTPGSGGGEVPPATPWDELYPATRDAYSFGLHYYNNDYLPINRPGAPDFISVLGAQGTNAKPLYNGNIAAMTVNIAKLGGANVYNYRYDQLNRLVSMDAYSGLTATGFTPLHLDDYKEQITYDPNGNIQSYLRNGTTAGGKPLGMDNLTYNYNGNTNQLNHITDAAATANYAEDIDGQNTNNYTYDAIGNLKGDATEGITSITWTVYGKIATISKSGTAIAYTYDAGGNRITKTVNGKTTVYVRDASGNAMSVYEKQTATALKQIETHLYGSSRAGILNELTVATVDVTIATGNAKLSTFTRGEKIFELANHLGNVLASINDKKIAHNAGNGSIDYYLADVMSASDYAPFGMQMVGRKWNSATYRYGFNGKENDNEVKGEGNQQDYGMRIYDPRLGKFLSVDPISDSYPMLTPYQFASNRPIDGLDLDGLEYLTMHVYGEIKNGKYSILKIVTEDHTNMTGEEIQRVHKMSAASFYSKFSKSFGSEGRGIKWKYYGNGRTPIEGWEMQQKGSINSTIPSESEMEYHGIYSGGGCITSMGPMFEHQGVNTIGKGLLNAYDFSRAPIDIVDDISKTHDMMQDGIVDYQGWLEDTRTLKSDIWINNAANNYLKSVETGRDMGIPYIDKFTGRAASGEALRRASGVIALFTAATAYKNFKIERIRKMKLDPNDAKSQGAVTLDDWKPRFLSKNWYYKKALEASGGGKSKEEMADYWKQNNE